MKSCFTMDTWFKKRGGLTVTVHAVRDHLLAVPGGETHRRNPKC